MSTEATHYTLTDARERIINLTAVTTATTHATVHFFAGSASEALGYVWSHSGFCDVAAGYIGQAQQKMAEIEFDYTDDSSVWLVPQEVTELTNAAREALENVDYAIRYETWSRAQPDPDSQQGSERQA